VDVLGFDYACRFATNTMIRVVAVPEGDKHAAAPLPGGMIMKKLLGVLLGLAIVLAAVGFFRGWFSITTTDEGTDTNVNLRIDRQRIKEDADLAREKAGELGSRMSGDTAEEEEASSQDDEVLEPESY
jgi:hypothetical protein